LEKTKVRDYLGDLVIDGRTKKKDVRMWTRFNWLMIGASGGLFWTRKWTFCFHKRRGISRLA